MEGNDASVFIAELRDIVYTFGMVVRAQGEIAAMDATNMQRQHLGQSMAYVDSDYTKVLDEYGVHHNGLVSSMKKY